MKTVFIITILLFTQIVLPAYSALSPDDLNQIRLIVKEEIAKELKPIKVDIITLKQDIAFIKGKFESVDKRFETVE